MKPVPKREEKREGLAALRGAFGSVEHLPPMDEIPVEFKRHNGTVWNKIVSQWLFCGLPTDAVWYPKKGVNSQDARAALGSILRSFEPQHEHKEAGVAYLMSEWFKKVKGWEK